MLNKSFRWFYVFRFFLLTDLHVLTTLPIIISNEAFPCTSRRKIFLTCDSHFKKVFYPRLPTIAVTSQNGFQSPSDQFAVKDITKQISYFP